jgi:hypothetical protein
LEWDSIVNKGRRLGAHSSWCRGRDLIVFTWILLLVEIQKGAGGVASMKP